MQGRGDLRESVEPISMVRVAGVRVRVLRESGDGVTARVIMTIWMGMGRCG